MLYRHRYVAGFLPFRSTGNTFPANTDLCGTRSLPASHRRRLLASPHLAKERPDPKPSLDAVMSQAQLEKKVDRLPAQIAGAGGLLATADYCRAVAGRNGSHGEAHQSSPRYCANSLTALGNDPFVIAECLARPALAERLLTNWYAYDQRIHGELKQRAEADLQAHPARRANERN